MDKSDRLTRCLDDIVEGKASLEDCLSRYPELGDELRELLAVAAMVQQQRAAISQEFKQKARRRMFDADVAREGRKPILAWLTPTTLADGLRVPIAALLVVLGLVGGSAGVVYASQSSLPGEVLYPVKTGSENVRLALTLKAESKARLNLELAERRVAEAVTQSERGDDVSDTTSRAVARHLDAAIEEMENLDEARSKSLISKLSEITIRQQATLNRLIAESPEQKHAALEDVADASRRGSTVAVMADANPAFLDSRPSVSDDRLEKAHFTLEGVLQSVGDDWDVGGVIIKSVSVPRDADYAVGKRVSIEGIIRGGKTFITSLKQKEGTEAEVSIEGVFNGTSPDGSIWDVSGISISKPQGISQVSEGTKLNLTGMVQNGNLVVTGQTSSGEEPKRDVKITGKLVKVSPDNATIVVNVAGAEITTNIEKAEVQAEDAPGFKRTDLRSLIGKEIRVSGLKNQDGIIYASKIDVPKESREHSSGNKAAPGNNRNNDREKDKSSEGQKKSD